MIKKDYKVPEKSADILQCHQWFRGEMTSETVWNFCLLLRRHFMGKPTVLLQNVGCSVRPATE